MAKASVPSVVLPDGFIGAVAPSEPKQTIPYVCFFHPLNKQVARIKAAIPTVRVGDPVLLAPEPAKPVHLTMLQYFLLGRHQFWAKFDQDGQPVDYSPTKVEDMVEVFETACIVFAPDDLLLPATIRFRGAQVPGIKAASEAYELAGTPTWLTLSEEHAATGVIPKPWARFTSTTTPLPPRKGSKGTYVPLDKCRVSPTTEKQYRKLQAFSADQAFADMVRAVCNMTVDRIKYVSSKQAA